MTRVIVLKASIVIDIYMKKLFDLKNDVSTRANNHSFLYKVIFVENYTILLILFSFWLSPLGVFAGYYDVQIDNIYYNLDLSTRTATVTYGSFPIYGKNFYQGTVSIPSSFEYLGLTFDVTAIGYGAFNDCDKLTSLIVPNSVIDVESEALEGSAWYNNQPDGMVYVGKVAYKYKGNVPDNTEIILKDGTLGISRGAFRYCNWLTSVKIPNSVTSIGSSAFSGCTGLTSIEIPNSVTSIGDWAFYDCTNLASVTMSNGVMKLGYDVFEGTAWYNDQPDGLIYLNNVAYKFKGEMPENTHITIKDGTVLIGGAAFSECSGLASIIIPNSVRSIGEYAFSGCASLTSIAVPNSVTSIGGSAFAGCSNLNSVSIPNSVTSINDGTFGGCTSLTSVDIPNSVVFIGEDAFNDAGLTQLSVPNSVLAIIGRSYYSWYYNPFDGTPWYDEQPDGVVYAGKVATSYKGNLSSETEIRIKEGTLGIFVGPIYGCSLNIPSSVRLIQFPICNYYCDIDMSSGSLGFESIEVDINNPVFDSRDNCNAIIETATNKLIFGSNKTTIPKGVVSIGAFTLNGVSSVTIPSSVNRIEDFAFASQREFAELLGQDFEERRRRVSCGNISTITMEASNPPQTTYNSFEGIDQAECSLYVPLGSKSVYENTDGWNQFENIIEYVPDTDISALDNAIYVDQTESRIGGTMDIPVMLKNSYPVRGFQFKLELPEGATINSWALSSGRMPSGATESDKIATQKIDGNTIAIACSLNYGDATFTGNDGEIATVNVTFAEDMEEGRYPIYLTGCDVTTADGVDEDLSDIKATLVLEDYLPGDANGDGKVRIGDATAILNYIVGNVSNNFQMKAADTNGDGRIRIGDATAVLNLIVNQL